MALKIDIVIPVYNEEDALPGSIAKLADFLDKNLPHNWQVIIADNASLDSTRAVAQELCREYPRVKYHHLPQKGRGRALRAAWLESDADIVSYMDEFSVPGESKDYTMQTEPETQAG